MTTKKSAKPSSSPVAAKSAEPANSPAAAKASPAKKSAKSEAAAKPKPFTPADATPPPTIPLTPDARIAYRALALRYETAIQSTTDVGALEALNGSMLEVDDILTKDNMYRLRQSTELYNALLESITTTNKDLKELQKQLAAIAANFAFSADVLSAIATVLKVIP